MIAKQRLYLTADKSAVVREGDEAAATLYATPGDEIPDSAAEKFGLVDGGLPKSGTSSAPAKPKGKTVKPASENKAAKAGATKDTLPSETKGAAAPVVPPATPPASAAK